jgi:predicted HicB family RNase H-like nuclease
MSKTQAQRRAHDKYIKEKIDELKIRVPKGKKAMLQDHASSLGESLNKFVNRAIDETVERDNQLLD